MSDSFEDYPPARASDDYMTTAEINEAIRIKHTDPEPNIAWMQSRIAELEAKVNYWSSSWAHCYMTKGNCSCQGRAEKLWCDTCKTLTKYRDQFDSEFRR